MCVFMYVQCVHKRMVRFQKLTRNLFLTLHGHNVHRQQRQLSKFLVLYQQLASRAYCGATGPVSKMVSQQENAFCVLRFEVSRSVIIVQRESCARFSTAVFACICGVKQLLNLVLDGNKWTSSHSACLTLDDCTANDAGRKQCPSRILWTGDELISGVECRASNQWPLT
jgi:hypothetical protein